jgi:hypothetical protein
LHAHQFRACGFYIFDAFNSNWARKAFETAYQSHMFVVCIQARDNRRLTPSPGRGGRYHDSGRIHRFDIRTTLTKVADT